MSVHNNPSGHDEVDLDATAELPILELDDVGTAIADELPESTVAIDATDTFATQAIPAGVADLADSLREVEHRLERKMERLAALETDLATAHTELDELRAQLAAAHRIGAEREASLHTELAAAAQARMDLQGKLATLQNDFAESRTQLQTQHAALTDSQQQAQQRASQQRDLERDLKELRRRSEAQHEALSTWQGFRATSEAILAQTEAQLDDVDAQHAAVLHEARNESDRLRNELAGVRQAAAAEMARLTQSIHEAELAQQAQAAELAATAARADELAAALAASRTAHAETAGQLEELQILEVKAREGAAQFDEHQRQIAALQAQASAAIDHQRETEAQLNKAGERVKRLEANAHASAAVMGNLQLSMQRLGRDDTGTHIALQPAPALPVLRVLIRHDSGGDVVYPLGKRTSIGRTPDNDIQVDATWISRHHAVLLSSPDQCIVEDLNSTNGVLVNGRRVGRQVLHDGDTVKMGKAEFRYQQRS